VAVRRVNRWLGGGYTPIVASISFKLSKSGAGRYAERHFPTRAAVVRSAATIAIEKFTLDGSFHRKLWL